MRSFRAVKRLNTVSTYTAHFLLVKHNTMLMLIAVPLFTIHITSISLWLLAIVAIIKVLPIKRNKMVNSQAQVPGGDLSVIKHTVLVCKHVFFILFFDFLLLLPLLGPKHRKCKGARSLVTCIHHAHMSLSCASHIRCAQPLATDIANWLLVMSAMQDEVICKLLVPTRLPG